MDTVASTLESLHLAVSEILRNIISGYLRFFRFIFLYKTAYLKHSLTCWASLEPHGPPLLILCHAALGTNHTA